MGRTMAETSRTQRQTGRSEIRPYDLFMLMLCMYSLMSLAAETFFHLSTNDVAILDTVDNVVCGIFLLDFFSCLVFARDKWKYLSWGWIDLLSSIPVIDGFQAGRVVRVVRILRVLRGIRMARMLAQYLQRHRADGAFLAVIFFSILLLLLSSMAILQVEQVQGANIQNASDALWWAIETMTTVGYGDKYPVTTVGRVIASVLMISGVGLFGTLSGSVASWIMNPVEERQEVDINAIQSQLAAIQVRLDHFVPRDKVALDPHLAKLVEAWPHLTDATRREVNRLIVSNSR
jgi:voltage-gated potassium channel